jgi:purine-binding chemotaxis protein CheW
MENRTATTSTSSTDSLTLLTFAVGEQTYSLPVTHVVRIIEMVTITCLPGMSDTIEGIINVQGKTVPVMDLRHRFGLPPQPYGLYTPIILVDTSGDGRMLGLIVDAVEDVRKVTHESLETTEMFVPIEMSGQLTVHTAFLAGVAKVDRQMVLVLNVRTLLTPIEQTQLSQVLGAEDTQVQIKS